jgi:hypothetical protein
MSDSAVDLEAILQNTLTSLNDPAGEAANADTTMRERFFELMVLIFGNLYTKTPVASALFDRNTLTRVTHGMDDGDAGRLAGRTEDWLRLEGLLRQQDGQKAYFVPRVSLSVMSTMTNHGTLGEVFAQVLKRYQAEMPSENIRRNVRVLGSYFLSRVARS